MESKNIILSDCLPGEIMTLADGCNEVSKEPFQILSSLSNYGHGSIFLNLKRYVAYFIFPLRIFFWRKRYRIILGWQQFYVINLALFCRLFHVRKRNVLIVGNFTYKRKKGLLGTIYRWYMIYCCASKYIDYFHVLSYSYASICSKELGIDSAKFIVTGFGIPDVYEEKKDLKVPLSNYCLTIGRSNRDFEFLVDVWKQDCLKGRTLVIASDTWKPSTILPSNIIFRRDIGYEDSFAWFNNCDLCITSIDDGNICSGDTVLLTGMMFAKPVVVTAPSTLAEMYVRDGENGLCIPKNAEDAAIKIAALLADKDEMKRLGDSARSTYLKSFSRKSLGVAICSQIKEAIN